MKRNLDCTPADVEISVISIIFAVLSKWRLLVLTAVIGCLIGAGFQFVRVQNGALIEEQEDYEIALADYKNNVASLNQTVRNTQVLLADYNKNLENSIFLNLDSEHVWTSAVMFDIAIDNDVLALYNNTTINPYALITNAYLDKLSVNLISAEDRKNLIGTDVMEYWDELVQISAANSGRMIKLVANGESQEFVNRITSFLEKKLLEEHSIVSKQIISHDIREYSSAVNETKNQQIASARQKLNDSVAALLKQNMETQSKLNSMVRDGEPVRPGNHIVKFAVLFGFLFAALSAAVLLLRYALSGLMHDTGFIQLYDAPLLGMIRTASESRNRIDKVLEKLKYRDFSSPEKEMESIIAYLSTNVGSGQVYVDGNAPEEEIVKICDALNRKTPDALEILILKDVLLDAGKIEKVKSSSGLLIVEKIGVSKMQDVFNEADKMITNHLNVLGWIVTG